MEICRYCKNIMRGETESLSSGNHYRFFYVCPECKAVYEGERKEKGKGVSKEVLINKSRWLNPETKKWEE